MLKVISLAKHHCYVINNRLRCYECKSSVPFFFSAHICSFFLGDDRSAIVKYMNNFVEDCKMTYTYLEV